MKSVLQYSAKFPMGDPVVEKQDWKLFRGTWAFNPAIAVCRAGKDER